MRAIAACFLLLLLFLPSVSLGQDHATMPSVELPPELDRVLTDYAAAWTGDDEDALAALFTPDGFVTSRSGWIRGREDIKQRYEETGGNLQLRAVAYATSDTVGYIIGAYGYGENPGGPDRGIFVLALRLGDDGRWLIAADIDRSNRN